MTSNKTCFVYIVLPGTTEFITAARFQVLQTRDGQVIGELIYGKKYLARPDAIELDPVELRLNPHQFQTTRMHGYFGAIRDAIPDFWGRKIIEYSNHTQLDEFDYLLLGPDDRAGALGFGLNVEPPAPRRSFNQTLDLAQLQKIAEIITNNGSIESSHLDKAKQVRALLLEGTSMGGARPKAVVEENNKLWIAKFSTPQDRWNQPIVEHAMLKLAKICKLNVAESKTLSIAGKDILLVKRFDRDKAKNGYHRHRMVSALTLLQADDDPTAREQWSYPLLADEIRRTSAQPKTDLRELFSRMCFNALTSNTDDHPRNHAILARDKDWRLSPAYDLTPTPLIAQESRYLAMSCGTQGRIARKENLLSMSERFLLEREDAENIIDKMATTIKGEWHDCFKRAGVTDRDCKTITDAFIYEGFFYK